MILRKRGSVRLDGKEKVLSLEEKHVGTIQNGNKIMLLLWKSSLCVFYYEKLSGLTVYYFFLKIEDFLSYCLFNYGYNLKSSEKQLKIF